MYKYFNSVVFRFPQYSSEVMENNIQNNQSFFEIIRLKEFQEAIYIASPTLYDELQKYLSGKIKDIDKEKLEFALFRYYTRMSTRCTPFGTFSGVSFGKIAEKTDIQLSGLIKKYTRLDMYFLCSLFQFIIKIPEIKRKTIYYANSTIYEINNKYRYIEYYYTNNNRKHQIVEIRKDYFISLIIKSVKNGCSYPQLKMILSEEGVTDEEAVIFLDNLISMQVIVSELEPTFIGEDYLSFLIKKLNKINCRHEVLPALEKIQRSISELDTNTDDFHSCYESIYDEINKLEISCNKATLFQVDCRIETNNNDLGQDIIDDLCKTLRFLNKITVYNENATLSAFKKAFWDRYEGQEVRLLEVLDPNIGLGYPINEKFNNNNALLANWMLPGPISNGISNTTIRPIDMIMLKKIFEYNVENEEEIVLTDEDVKGLGENWDDLPLSICAKIELENSSQYTIDGISGSTAAYIIARFSHCDEQIENYIKQITEQEQKNYEDKVLAEVIHLPESRIGNILSRPHCRKSELIYLAGNSDNHNSLSLDDLYISLKNNKLIIRSKTLDKEILPRLTSAHNYHRNPTPVYRFLCDLQHQNMRSSLYFSWNDLFRRLEHLPRVVYSKAILSPEMWNIPIADWQVLRKEKNDIILLEKVHELKNKYSLKDEFLLADGDNTLYVNLKSLLSIRTFLDVIKNRQQIQLKEYLNSEDELVKSQSGAHRNECIIAFYKEKNEKE